MKQIIQHLNSGETSLIEVPAPMVKDGHLLIQSACSLVSAGTERMLIDFGKANWINKARQQPERVKDVLNKIKTEGLLPTIEAVKSKINKPIPLGYSNAGTVVAVGNNVHGFKVGDRVASNGAHAEMVQVPQNLCAKIPDAVSDESAAFTVVGAIALQGIRLIQPSFGETVVVVGLGLIGQIAVQLLLANGCCVIGVDPDEQKCNQVQKLGAVAICNRNEPSVVQAIFAQTNNAGADAVLITASSKEQSVIADAAQMCRKRARIVLIGVIGLHLNRADFYEKELTFQVSCSYGPGRYDYDYEQNSKDYPIGFVRWTAQRNFEAVLQAMALAQLKLEQLITQKIPLEEFSKVYSNLSSEESAVSVFVYDKRTTHQHTISFNKETTYKKGSVAIIGAGNFASKVIVPLLKKNKTDIRIVASANGLSAAQLAKQFNVALATTDLEAIWSDNSIASVLIATQHNTHADLCIKALHSGKCVFVEKPLAISIEEIEAVKDAVQDCGCTLDVGFNRRHAPLAIKMKQLLGDHSLVNMVMTINAGVVPANNWLADKAKSGGRIIGELCHFIDLAAFISGSKVNAVCANALANNDEDVTLLLKFENGSSAALNYFSNGNKAYDKERIEVFSEGKTLILENWKRLTGYGFGGFSSTSSGQDKGHERQFNLLTQNWEKGGTPLIPFDSIYNTNVAAIAAVESLKEQKWIRL